MICGVVAGVVATTGAAVVGATVAGVVVAAAVVDVEPPATVVDVVDVVVVASVPTEVFDPELQPTMTALIKIAGMNLRRDVIRTLYATRTQW